MAMVCGHRGYHQKEEGEGNPRRPDSKRGLMCVGNVAHQGGKEPLGQNSEGP